MTARRVLGRLLGRTLAAMAVVAVVLLSTGAVASATQGIDPFKPIATGSGPGSSSGGSQGTTSTTIGTTGGTGTSTGSTGSSTTGSGTPSAPTSNATNGNGSLAFTGGHTMSIFVLGLITIFLGVPMVRAGRRWFDARHWPAC